MIEKPRWLFSVPILVWGPQYSRENLSQDGFAAFIVTLMLIPQSLAYATLAGLPPVVGLYASVAPLLVYAVLGSSRVLAVGPVAVVSLMTAATVAEHAAAGTHAYWQVAMTLALLSGALLFLMGLLRLGFLANFLSHPVISGFITASGLLIALSQVKTIMAVKAEGDHFFDLLLVLIAQAPSVHGLTLILGVVTIGFLVWVRKGLRPLLIRFGLPLGLADFCVKAGPVAAIVLSSLLAWALDWQEKGVKLVGAIPQGLPPLTVPIWDPALWRELLVPALLISA
ncbi:MAG: sodium-independent anion transporter, partial [Betaproteobacteria bacterium]|nr:sodium-independent anion transporter [Betaproteobacteria bacterium]